MRYPRLSECRPCCNQKARNAYKPEAISATSRASVVQSLRVGTSAEVPSRSAAVDAPSDCYPAGPRLSRLVAAAMLRWVSGLHSVAVAFGSSRVATRYRSMSGAMRVDQEVA